MIVNRVEANRQTALNQGPAESCQVESGAHNNLNLGMGGKKMGEILTTLRAGRTVSAVTGCPQTPVREWFR